VQPAIRRSESAAAAGAVIRRAMPVPSADGPGAGNATIEVVETFFREEEGQPPVDFEQGVFTPVLEGGDEQVSAASLDSGRWALVCLISNREGRPPHIEMGMIDEVEVE
jgi:hypothetical protein